MLARAQPLPARTMPHIMPRCHCLHTTACTPLPACHCLHTTARTNQMPLVAASEMTMSLLLGPGGESPRLHFTVQTLLTGHLISACYVVQASARATVAVCVVEWPKFPFFRWRVR